VLDKLIDTLLQFLDHFAVYAILDEYERGVVMRLGRPHRDIGPGLHWHWPLAVERVLRDNVVTDTIRLHSQSLTTSDGHGVTVSAVVTFTVTDVRKALLEVSGKIETLVDSVAGTVSTHVGESTWADLSRGAVQAKVLREARREAKAFGLEIVRVRFSDCAKVRAIRLIQN
jgi:membrane protease subunit HflK